jgi:hypothetical protein
METKLVNIFLWFLKKLAIRTYNFVYASELWLKKLNIIFVISIDDIK